MEADAEFRHLSKSFWADVRTIGEAVGYTLPRQNMVRAPTIADIQVAYGRLGLGATHLIRGDRPTAKERALVDYLKHRANVLNEYVSPRLMDVDRAKAEFERLRSTLNPSCPLPMNKQRGDKRAPAYFTGIVNMLVEAHSFGQPCDYDPRRLTMVTANGTPLRTFARRVDGAFPSVVDPVAVWEIKEYYYTTTFGSRVADGVYETLLDGMEIEELATNEGVDLLHYLMVDSHFTWWQCGRSYLCRMVDMLHMGYVDEVLFGYEVIERLPKIVEDWHDRL